MKLVIGISGATGSIYGIRTLEILRELGIESHLILSEWAEKVIEAETSYTVSQVRELACVVYDNRDLGAAVSSGSFHHDGMIVVPCSMKTLAGIHCGFSDDLLIRAADVTIKERRRLVLAVRETPFSQIHLRNMLELSQMGVSIVPPVPSFYNNPKTLDDVINQSVGRLLDQGGVESGTLVRWS